MKKVLILGGKPIGSCELVEALKKRGLHTIVADYLPKEQSAAKMISDEQWDISTADIEGLKKKCIENDITAVMTAVNEFNIKKKIQLCEELNIPQYCTSKQWDFCGNKALFKKMCSQYKISVAHTYDKDDEIQFPVIVKPTDSSGSRGFSVCHNKEELLKGIDFALRFSANGEYLIEEYFQCDACIIHYTAINGKIIFSGMSDKISKHLEGGSSVMALQKFPSNSIQRYLSDVNENAIEMFKNLGIKNGPIWIEAFNDKSTGRFVFNEMGYRFGGSMTNYPVNHFYGIDQLDLMISNAIGENVVSNTDVDFTPKTNHYCILPIHLKAGKMEKVTGLDKAKLIKGVEKIVMVHYEGDNIENWGTAQNVFCYLHVSYNTADELVKCIESVKNTISVRDEKGLELLFTILDLNEIGKM